MIDLKALRAKAEAAKSDSWNGEMADELTVKGVTHVCEGCVGPAEFYHNADALFIAAANPLVILELLDRLEALERTGTSYKTEPSDEPDYLSKYATLSRIVRDTLIKYHREKK